MLSEARPLLRNAASSSAPRTESPAVTLRGMKDPVDRAVRAIARRQPFGLLWAQFLVTHLVMLGGMGILRLYQPMSAAQFWVLVAISQVLVGIDNLISAKLTYKLLRPVRAWLRAPR